MKQKHLIIAYKCRINFDQKWNNDKCRCRCEYKNLSKHQVCDKNSIQDPSTCSCENGKYLRSINDDSVITYDEIIEATKTVPTKTIPPKTITTKTISTKFNKKSSL